MNILTLLLIDEAAGASGPWTWVGALVGSAIGLIGGAFGTWNSLRHTKPGRERSFMKRVAVLAWGVVIVFLAGLFLVPAPWSLLLWIPYGVLLVVGILRLNQAHARIRAEELGVGPEAG